MILEKGNTGKFYLKVHVKFERLILKHIFNLFVILELIFYVMMTLKKLQNFTFKTQRFRDTDTNYLAGKFH